MGMELLPVNAPTSALYPNLEKLSKEEDEFGSPGDLQEVDTADVGSASGRGGLLLVSFEFHMERLTVDNVRGQFSYEKFQFSAKYRFEQGGGEGAAVLDPSEFLERLKEHFGPGKTADRIAAFVKGGFGKTSFGGEDTEESRRSFVDFILPFIRKGVDEALSLFKGFEEVVKGPGEETFARIKNLLEEFVQGEKREEVANAEVV